MKNFIWELPASENEVLAASNPIPPPSQIKEKAKNSFLKLFAPREGNQPWKGKTKGKTEKTGLAPCLQTQTLFQEPPEAWRNFKSLPLILDFFFLFRHAWSGHQTLWRRLLALQRDFSCFSVFTVHAFEIRPLTGVEFPNELKAEKK